MNARLAEFLTIADAHDAPLMKSPLFLTIVIALASAWALNFLGWVPEPKENDRAALFGTLAQVAGTMLGFMLAALAVVASINHTHLVKMMRKTGHYRSLLVTLFSGALVFLVCAVMSLLALLGVPADERYMAILLGLHIAALCALSLAGWQFWLVLSNLHSE